MMSHTRRAGLRSDRVSRRRFLRRTTTAGALFAVVPAYVLGAEHGTPPSETLNVAVVGAGGQGIRNIRALLTHADVCVTAICDVADEIDYRRFWYGGTGGRQPALALVRSHDGSRHACEGHADFRKMLDAGKAIDAVLIATPDHTHAVVAMAAIRRGKHVYCEKPLAHSVYEARMVTEAARNAGVATQMGNQGHSGEGIRLTVEWIRDGAIGPVREVHAWSKTGVDWAGYRVARPVETPPVPRGLDWDLWLGPARKRPYHPAYHPYNWRGWWDFGTGAIGDMACHNLDPAFWALELGHPTSIEGRATNVNPETTPFASIVYYDFPARGRMPPVKVTWYSGGIMPPRPPELEPGRDLDGRGDGILFVGDKGKLMCAGWAGSPRLIPETRMKAYERPPRRLPRSKGHHRDWIDACKGRTPASAHFDYAGPMTETVLLGNVALRTGKRLLWDGPNLRATNAPDADRYIRPEYHNGWKL